MFDWYQPVYYHIPVLEFTFERKAIGRWLGVAEDCTDNMAYVNLAKIGRIVVQKSVWELTDDDLGLPSTKEKLLTNLLPLLLAMMLTPSPPLTTLTSWQLRMTNLRNSQTKPLPASNIITLLLKS
jgi:hypothetical protein